MKFKQISWKRRLPKNVLSDSTIEFVVYKSSKDYPATLRRVVYLDEEQGREFMFLTNNFELPASVIAELYHNRWNIELFFYEKYIIMQSYVVGIHSNKQIV